MVRQRLVWRKIERSFFLSVLGWRYQRLSLSRDCLRHSRSFLILYQVQICIHGGVTEGSPWGFSSVDYLEPWVPVERLLRYMGGLNGIAAKIWICYKHGYVWKKMARRCHCDVLWVVVDTGTCIENFGNRFSSFFKKVFLFWSLQHASLNLMRVDSSSRFV